MHDTDHTLYRKTILGLTLIGMLLIAVVGWTLYDLRRAAWSHAASTSTNLVTALARDFGRTIATYDLSLLATLRALHAPADAQLDPVSFREMLFDGAIDAAGLGSVFVMDADGHIVHDSGATTPRGGEFADRDYFIAHRVRADAGLFISQPYRSRIAGEWSIALSRRVDAADGSFAGIVVGSIRYSYFAVLFANLDLGSRGSIGLTRTDGRLIYRYPFSEADIGRDVRGNAVFRAFLTAESGQYESRSSVDQRARLFAFTHIAGLPLVLSVNSALDAIYAQWRVKASIAGGAALLLLLTGLWLLRALRVQRRRRIQAEQATRRVADMFQAYFQSAADALFLLDVAADGTLRYERLNPACEQLTGISTAQAKGRRPADLFDADMARSLDEHYLACAKSGQTLTYEMTRELPAGRREWHTVLSPVRGAGGAVTLVLGSSRDMTEQNRLECERAQSSKMEAVGRLTAGVAHDFNNYLQTITSSLEVLTADFPLDGEAQGIARLAHSAATDGARVTQRLLAFSRQQVLQPRRLNVAALLNDTRKLVGTAALGPRIRVKIAVEPFTDDIMADPAQAESCLLNLLLNAAEAMPAGGSLVLHARNAGPQDGLAGAVAGDSHVILAVHDTGRGMDEATRSRAFDPFFTTKAFGNGSGLGLSMAQGFCRQTGGDIRLLSGGAVGTRVELWLPAAPADALAGQETQFNLATIGRGTGRVLLVEDEPDVAMALSATLVSGGFEVVAVTNAADGLLRVRDRDPYDAVLTDYSMPDMTGMEFLVHVAEAAPNVPTLLLTGFDMADVTVPALLRLPRMLRKPIRRTALLNAVREAIGENCNAPAA